MIDKIMRFFKNRNNLNGLFFSAALTLNSLFFLASKKIFTFAYNSIDNNLYYFIYFAIFAIYAGFHLSIKKFNPADFLKNILLISLPSQILMSYRLQNEESFNPYIGLAGAAYVLLLIIFIILKGIAHDRSLIKAQTKAPRSKGHAAILIAILSIMAISMSFGLFSLGKMAVVDEPLWTFARTPNFWRNISEMDWRSARVSDKPGLTVATLSGIGLLSEEKPQYFKNMPRVNNGVMTQEEITNFNSTFRLPIWIFVVLMIPIIYLLLQKLVGTSSALISVAFIGLSPIIIGNSRIINPDSILWIFVTLAITTYLLYFRNARRSTLFLSAFFLALGILTKYTANILYLFFLALIFAEYIFNNKKYSEEKLHPYLKKKILDYLLLIILSVSLFYVLYPAVWEKPDRILIGTIYSQAFEPIWPLFAGALGFILADIFILKSLIMGYVVRLFLKIKRPILIFITGAFIASIILTILNTYLGMEYFNFEEILASPKSSFSKTSVLGFFLANFYPMVFGISTVALSALFIFLVLSFRKNYKLSQEKILTVFYLILFVLAYYLGSVASHVASIIRYQVVVFPIIFIASGIAASELFRIFILKKNDSEDMKRLKQGLSFAGLILILSISLWQTKPFYMGYASVLLPEKYFLDIKDMGEGSYEAAAYLNSLPDAAKIKIWTDKNGVCVFFVGSCQTNLSRETFEKNDIDYMVVSSGRRSRTTKMGSAIRVNGYSFIDIYDSEKFAHKIEIAGRSNNYVKIVDITNPKP